MLPDLWLQKRRDRTLEANPSLQGFGRLPHSLMGMTALEP